MKIAMEINTLNGGGIGGGGEEKVSDKEVEPYRKITKLKGGGGGGG